MLSTYPQLWFTYGPRTKESDTIKELLNAGATGARLTFSYGTPELQAQRAIQIRSVARTLGHDVYIVADLQGEKCRFSPIEGTDEVGVKAGEAVLLSPHPGCLNTRPMVLQVQLPDYLAHLHPGDVIVEGDGALLLTVVARKGDAVLCEPLSDGAIHPGRGILLRKREFRPKAITMKDQADLTFILSTDLFDAVAVSFVSRRQDVTEARHLVSACQRNIALIAKIETQLGLDNVDDIFSEADAVMAARGDLALTMPWEELPLSMGTLSRAATRVQKPWILATQIVEGMERFSFPTRAEICDLARWMSDGAFGVMLSYETAFGRNPVEAVGATRRILDRYKNGH